jgi:hypothetical protein
MKFSIKDAIIAVLVIVILLLIFPRVLSFASEMNQAPAPAPSPSMNANCLPNAVQISQLCPSDYPHTGDITSDGMKYCCK